MISKNNRQLSDVELEQRQTERRERQIERLGNKPKSCYICGLKDVRALQDDHIFGRANSNTTGPLCLNHHAMVTDHINDHPKPANAQQRSSGEVMADMLMNLADRIEEFARFVVEVLRAFADYCREYLTEISLPPPPYSFGAYLPKAEGG